MNKINKGTKIVIICVIILTAGVALFAALNADDISQKRELELNAGFIIKYENAEKCITMKDMLSLNPVEFTAIMDTSTTNPAEVTFTGVELKKICESIGLDISGAEVFEVRALDGYSSALSIDEVMSEGNVYICINMNGEVLKTKSEGGFGPYMMVIISSEFSQRWCKFVEEISIR